MKLSETCTCGAGFTVEDDDLEPVRVEMAKWRESHKCVPHGRYADPHSVSGGQFSLGFGTAEQELRT